jgi:hypothetical protein
MEFQLVTIGLLGSHEGPTERRWRQFAHLPPTLSATDVALAPNWRVVAELAKATRCQLKEGCELRACLELGDRVEILERARERIGETPCHPGSEFLDLWIEIQIVHAASEMLRNFQLALHEGSVDDELRGLIRKAGPFPGLDLLPHRLEVPLHAVHADREDVHEA